MWLTPYNSRDLIDDFIREHEVQGRILVSKLGKDGAIGDEDIHTLVADVYHLPSLNDRYEEFLSGAKKGRKRPFQLAIMYYAILDDDPQLPFSLLPKNWLGDYAHAVFESIVMKTTNGLIEKYKL